MPYVLFDTSGIANILCITTSKKTGILKTGNVWSTSCTEEQDACFSVNEFRGDYTEMSERSVYVALCVHLLISEISGAAVGSASCRVGNLC
jgi:hypothetical protein